MHGLSFYNCILDIMLISFLHKYISINYYIAFCKMHMQELG